MKRESQSEPIRFGQKPAARWWNFGGGGARRSYIFDGGGATIIPAAAASFLVTGIFGIFLVAGDFAVSKRDFSVALERTWLRNREKVVYPTGKTGIPVNVDVVPVPDPTRKTDLPTRVRVGSGIPQVRGTDQCC